MIQVPLSRSYDKVNMKSVLNSASSTRLAMGTAATSSVPACTTPKRQRVDVGLWLAGGAIVAASMWWVVWARINHHASMNMLVFATAGMAAVYLLLLMLRPNRASRNICIAMIVVAVLM